MHRVHFGLALAAAVFGLLALVGTPFGPMRWVQGGKDVYFAASYDVLYGSNVLNHSKWAVFRTKCDALVSQRSVGTCPNIERHCKTTRALVPTVQLLLLAVLLAASATSVPRPRSGLALARVVLLLVTAGLLLGVLMSHVSDECSPPESMCGGSACDAYELMPAPVVLVVLAMLALGISAGFHLVDPNGRYGGFQSRFTV